ncbi:MAG: hypothetical protein FD180_2339 [Planctomycetota bacterium]|nr:MAG: hypothetical protein FD180_2339 [Planctomycetota bacterium]
MKRLIAITAALAITLAGAFPLYAGDRGEAWGNLLRRCDGRMSRAEEQKLGKAIESLNDREKSRLRARLKRIELLTRAWVRAERQAKAAAAARAVLGLFGPAPGVSMNIRPALDFIMELNGFGTKKEPGVLGKRGKKMI